MELLLNGNKIDIQWQDKFLKIIINDDAILYPDDMHSILRAVNEVRREKWKAYKENGTYSIQKTKKRKKLENTLEK